MKSLSNKTLGIIHAALISTKEVQPFAASEAGKKIEVKTILCSRAFEEIKKGNVAGHNELLLSEIDIDI